MESKSRAYAWKTFKQLVKYGIVSAVEWGAGWLVLNRLDLATSLFWAYLVSSALIGLAGFFLRKLWVFSG